MGPYDEHLVRDFAAMELGMAVLLACAAIWFELFEELRAHFDERQMVELTMAIAFENLASRNNWALGIESEGFSEGSYCVRPDNLVAAIAEVGAER
jgi:alkylhydroperoxidase family enzyme